MDQRDSGGRTLLMLAAADGDDEAVRMLLSMGAATEKRCMGYTALIIAVREGHNQVVRTLLNEGKTTIDKVRHAVECSTQFDCGRCRPVPRE